MLDFLSFLVKARLEEIGNSLISSFSVGMINGVLGGDLFVRT